MSSSKTGVVYDDLMLKPHNLWYEDFIECPERLSASIEKCEEYHLLERCTRIPSRSATDEEILSLHSEKLLRDLNRCDTADEEVLKELTMKYQDVYFHYDSAKAARLSLGAALDLVENVALGKLRNGFGLIRPPGHHAMCHEANGFCYLNNAALAAQMCLDKLGMKRVLIVDWDVHHGQGSQLFFYEEPRVLYVSTHRYEWGRYWPHLRQSDFDQVGDGKARGFNMNIPMNETGCSDFDFLLFFHNVILPVAFEFNPELIIVSAGYDAAIGCPEGCMKLSPPLYAHMTRWLMALADGKVAVLLEGGYFIESLAEGVAMTLRALLGDPLPRLFFDELSPKECCIEAALNVIAIQRQFWKSLTFQGQSEEYLENRLKNINETKRMGIKYATPYFLERGPKTSVHINYVPRSEEAKAVFREEVKQIMKRVDLSVPQHRTGVCFDFEMNKHKNLFANHPESPDRVTYIVNKLEQEGHMARCLRIPSRSATDAELQLFHTEEHVARVQSWMALDTDGWKSAAAQLDSIYMCGDSFSAATLATGSLLNVIDNVMRGECTNGFAIIRPPGHHAERDVACGFCFFNSVAIAAKWAQNKFAIKRIMILDWDVHHGNGTQHCFYGDTSVLYVSLHRFDNGTFYPGKPDADSTFTGGVAALGFNMNIPWNVGGVGDPEYIAAFQQLVMPVAYEFNPDLVLVSAGFDAAIGDPLGRLQVSPEAYGHMTHMLCSLANGRVVLALEGGYNLTTISQAAANCTSVLLGDTPASLCLSRPPLPSAVQSIRNTTAALAPYWKCLRITGNLPRHEPAPAESKPPATATSTVQDITAQMAALATNEPMAATGTITAESKPAATATSTVQDITVQMAALATAEPGAVGGSAASSSSTVADFLGNQFSSVDTLYAVEPLPWCPHLELVQPLPPQGIDVFRPCDDCHDASENWVCLQCYAVGCARYVGSHMLQHREKTDHCMVLSFADLSVWCYVCDAYVHHERLHAVKSAAHLSKFNTAI